MKRMKKRMLALMAILVLAVSMLTGCGGMTEEDAKEYVKATLDASYKADFDAYMKVTDSSKEEVQKLYDDNIENIVTSSGLQDMGITSELEEKYRELYKNMLSKAKYTVGDAKETDGGFEVVVKVEPFAFMEGVEGELTEAIQNELLAIFVRSSSEILYTLSFSSTVTFNSSSAPYCGSSARAANNSYILLSSI